jgi:hypothetical protein
MKRSVAARQVSLVAAMAVLLAGCGGGGESGSAVLANPGAGGSPAAVTTPGSIGVAAPGSVTDPAAVVAPVTVTDTPVVTSPVSTDPVVVANPVGVTDPVVGAGQASTLSGQTLSTMEFHGTAPDQTQVAGPRNVVVGDGVEVINEFFAGFVTIDFSGTSIRMTAAVNQPFGYFEVLRIFDTNGTIRPITSVTVDPATNYAGFDASRLNFTADSIDINLTALHGRSGEQIVLNIGFGAP